jgi:hypothetical protein
MGKIQRFVKKIADKHFIVYVYSDSSATPSIMVGPRHIVVVANSADVDDYINRILELNPTCTRCGRYSNYFRVETRPDGVGAVCGDCDPAAKFSVLYFELVDLILPL